MDTATDIAIIGGGPVGAALALALRDSGLAVTVLEARSERADATGRQRDPRPIALSHGSRLLLERLGVWQGLAPTPITGIHVSQRGGFGRVAISARELNVPALGYVVDYGAVFAVLADAARGAGCTYREGARAVALRRNGDRHCIDYVSADAQATLNSCLVVVADGGDIDGLAPPKIVDYGQYALTARVHTALPHQNTAYERFTPEGPLALLPFGEDMALVWTLGPERAQALQATDCNEFLAVLHQAFGGRLGEFRAVHSRASYPLSLRYAVAAARPGVVAIGNAAQTLHPVAGQGFNLGLRDAWELAQMVRGVSPQDIALKETLSRFSASRRVDRYATLGATHGLVRLFSNDLFPLDLMRGAGMSLLGSVAPLRDFLARRMMFGARG